MATVLNRTTLDLIESAHTPDYDPAQWLINPDLSGVAGLPRRYWKIVGNDVVPMTAAEMAAVDAEIADLAAAVPSTTVVFGVRGNVDDEWLRLWFVGTSDQTSWIAHVDVTLSLMGFSNRRSNINAAVDVYSAGAVIASRTVSTSRFATTQDVASVTIPRGNDLAVRIRHLGNASKPRDPVVWLVFRENARTRGSVSA